MLARNGTPGGVLRHVLAYWAQTHHRKHLNIGGAHSPRHRCTDIWLQARRYTPNSQLPTGCFFSPFHGVYWRSSPFYAVQSADQSIRSPGPGNANLINSRTTQRQQHVRVSRPTERPTEQEHTTHFNGRSERSTSPSLEGAPRACCVHPE